MADGGGMGGFLGEVGQVVKQQGQKVAGQISGQVIKQITGSNNQTPAGQSPKTTTGIDLVDFGKVATGQLTGNKSASNATSQSKTSGLGTSIFGNKKAGVFDPNKQAGLGDLFGGEFDSKKTFGFGPKKSSGWQAPNQVPDFSEDEAESKRKLEELRKKLFDETYGRKIEELGKTDQNKKQQEEEQKKQQEEERKKQEEQEKAQEEQEGLGDFNSNVKQKKGMIGQPRNKKSGFNFLKWLKPKRQSNESNSGNRG